MITFLQIRQGASAFQPSFLVMDEGVDVWMQYPAPFGGQGLNQSADLILPQQILTLTAQVISNRSPLANANATFEIRDNKHDLLKVLEGVTNASGLASVVYEMPWPGVNPESLLGLWQVKALTNATGVWMSDVMNFQYDYLVRIWSVSTNKLQYEHLETVKTTVVYGTLAKQNYDVWMTTVIQDNLQVPLGTSLAMKTIGGATVNVYENYTGVANIRIPYWAYVGWAVVRVNVLDKRPSEGGAADTPEARKSIWILPSVRTEPTADFSFDPEVPRVRRTVSFNATTSTSGWSESKSAPTQIVNYTWNFGDDSVNYTAASPLITHAYENAGGFTVTLTVVDNEGQRDSTVQTVSAQAVTDISVTAMTTSKTIVGQDSNVSIRVTVQNKGDLTETFSLTAYADLNANIIGDEITIETQTTTLPNGDSATLILTFRTHGATKGNYTITAHAVSLPNETDTANNILSSAWIIVSTTGDVTGPAGVPDGRVDIRDLAVMAKSFGASFPEPRYNPNYDLNSDGAIDLMDLAAAAKEYGTIDP